ncbi:hypothetical protein D9M72_379070 [compost metagenome]
MIDQRIEAVDRRGGDVERFEQRHPFVGAALRGQLGKVAVQRADIGIALRAVADFVAVGKVVAADRAEEGLPVAFGIGQCADPAIARRRGAAAALQQPRIAGAGGSGLEGQAAQVLGHDEGGHGLQHRHFDRLAHAMALAVQQRGQHCIGQCQPGGLVGDQAGHVFRPLAVAGAQRHQSAAGLDNVVEGGLVAVRAVLAEAGRDAVHDARVDARDRLVAKAQPLDRRHAHVMHQHVGAGDQRAQRFGALRGLQVEHDRALVAVQRQVDRAHAGVLRHAVGAHQVAFRPFDLDHVGAKIGQHLRGQRTEHDRGEIQHADAVERAGGRGMGVLSRHGWLLSGGGTPACGARPLRPRLRGNRRCGTARAGWPAHAG